MQLSDLLEDVQARVPGNRRKAIDAIIAEYGASETFRFVMALTAACTKRERHKLRLLLRELDRIDVEASTSS